MSANRRSLLAPALVVLAAGGFGQWWAGSHERQLGREVAELARPGDIRMLSSDSCAICTVARRWFKQHGVAFSECSVERDPVCRAAHEATGAAGTPVLLVRGQPQLGFAPKQLLASLGGGLR